MSVKIRSHWWFSGSVVPTQDRDQKAVWTGQIAHCRAERAKRVADVEIDLARVRLRADGED